ncbi:hypothetical protein pmac_cds_413 [Pandoravirus macleodensis]|uniref:Uncharacterized protein n=1 Tax=Pandoravirus macleodensis TaxID=2107707 RepID=A0A2U7UF83_9VIRU|nr:hypothetical protein pmac_cds_413 [Pandoravirus macleodensis]AVK77101.1 hypothetical protein pmac_cds_413 [Pandoravirus macleodensis]
MQRRQHKPTPIVSTRVMLSASKAKAALLAHVARQKALRSEAFGTNRSLGVTAPADYMSAPPPCHGTSSGSAVDSGTSVQNTQQTRVQETEPVESDTVEQQIIALTATIKDIRRRIKAHTSTAATNTTRAVETETTVPTTTSTSTETESLTLGSIVPQALSATDDKQEENGCESRQRVPRVITGPISYEPLAEPSAAFWWE